ncbi:helix-turn-helix domain-containing protein [Corynebacterium glyciniphilum]|uniref:helix-turn-helix domain-containing protein n=1 Tax=Corynebacterium glyciniphilum TaxID=1404244 RepID=UPI002357ADA8
MASIDRMTHAVELRSPIFFWTVSGSAQVVVRTGAGGADGVLRVGGGQGIWIDQGARVRVDRAPDAVVVGFRCSDADVLPFSVSGTVSTGPVGERWRSSLVDQFASSLGYLRESRPSATMTAGIARPPLPTSAGGRAAANLILDAPESSWTVSSLADAVHVSPATLNRQFRRETSLSVGQWRARARIVTAEVLLKDGDGNDGKDSEVTLETAAHRVGLSSASALSRLFRRAAGMTAMQVRSSGSPWPAASQVLCEGRERSTWPRTNRMHVLVWVYQGSAWVSAGDRTLDLEEGDLVWLPAGIPNTVRMGSGSLVLPVGARVGKARHTTGPVCLRAGDLGADVLLGAAAQEYDPLFARQTALVDGLFYTYLANVGDEDLQHSRLMTRLLEAFRQEPSSDRTAEEWAEHFGCSRAALRGALAADGVGDFRQWRTSTRMGIARQLLFAGVPVTRIAQHLGYSTTSSFSHVFARHHGVPPSRYRGYV